MGGSAQIMSVCSAQTENALIRGSHPDLCAGSGRKESANLYLITYIPVGAGLR